jgi:phage shock protein PspC (stress-responsive transcriptional regulator)
MEKIININFHGRVIPIEESAYDTLKQYTEGLRRHFAGEEGADEIVNDIEDRIAELLTARIRQGASCINNTDLNAVIDNIGRVEDIKAADGEEANKQQTSAGLEPMADAHTNRFYRNADDKVIAGVCSGIAVRMNIDPVVVRIIFVLLFGAFFWLYLLLWIIVPLESVRTHVTRRLFRNADDKVIAGVCGGLSVYFRMESWKVRAIFLAPMIISALFRSMSIFTWHSSLGPGFFIGGFGSSLFILYIILWIAVPYASSATERMEMRGEKIDINSIKAASQARTNAGASPRSNSVGRGIGRAIGILFKAFFLFIAGTIAVALFFALISLVIAGSASVPFAAFLFNGWQQSTLAWVGAVLVFGIPLLGLIVWFIRRLMGVRSKRHYLGFVFTGLWLIGVVCAMITVGSVMHHFSSRGEVEEQLTLQQPSTGRLYINVSDQHSAWMPSHHRRWFSDWDNENSDAPFHFVNGDSLWLNNVKVNIEQSPDSLFHVYEAKASRGVTTQQARDLATHIDFQPAQLDSVIILPRGFTISSADKFRNQQVLITVEVPLGKNIQLSNDVNEYNWYTINSTGSGIRYTHHNREGHNHYGTDKQYMMTASGLKNRNDTTQPATWGDDDDDNDE